MLTSELVLWLSDLELRVVSHDGMDHMQNNGLNNELFCLKFSTSLGWASCSTKSLCNCVSAFSTRTKLK